MICQDCKKREATKKMTVVEGQKTTILVLCEACAAARGFHSPLANVPFPLAEILSSFASSPKPPSKAEPMAKLVCPTCHLTFEEFTRQGRFGCGDCYRAFRPHLEGLMRKIHGNSLHRGKTPVAEVSTGDTGAVISVKEEKRLESELKKAIQAEDFERAAEIRDKLKSLKEHLSVNS
ncbi:MAG: UvrB/UvrC motif-containing protein [Candidatus Zixiibacteriota bacterium]